MIETEGPFGGALEGYSFATFGPGMLENSIAHELSHTWWGGLVPCPYTRSMWDEGFAEYSDSLFQRSQADGTVNPADRVPTPQALQKERQKMADLFADPPLGQAFDTSDGTHSLIGYGKGERVMRALEEELGQETIKRCLAAFVTQHPRGTIADWPDWEATVDKVTGKDYRWFLNSGSSVSEYRVCAWIR